MEKKHMGTKRRRARMALVGIMLAAVASPSVSSDDAAAEVFYLPEIVVSAGRLPAGPVRIDKLPIRARVITRAELREKGHRTVPDVLRSLPGFTLRDEGGNRHDLIVSLRGFDKGEDVLVLLDGVKMNLPSTNSVDWQALPDLDAVERIEVLYGPASAIHGAGAQSAVVSIITRKRIERPEFELTAGSFERRGGRLAAGLRRGAWNWSVTGRYLEEDGYRANSASELHNAGLTVNRVGEADELTVQGFINRGKVGAPNAITETEMAAFGRRHTAAANLNDFRRVDQDQIRLGYRRDFAAGRRLHANLSRQWRRTRFHSTSRVFGSIGDLRITENVEAASAVFEEKTDFGRIVNTLVGGLEFSSVDQFDRGHGTFPDERASGKRTAAGFIENTLELTPTFTLVGGVRRDRIRQEIDDRDDDSPVFSFTYRPTTWRLGGAWRLHPEWRLYAQYGEAFMPPNFADIAAFSGPFATPNYNLKPEESRQWHGGLQGAWRRWRIDLGYFRILTENEIAFNTNTWINENLTSTERKGWEFGLGLALSEQWDLSVTHTDISAKIERQLDNPAWNGRFIPMVPQRTWNGTLAWKPRERVALALDGRHVSEQHVQGDNANELARLPEYTVFDLRADWRLSERRSLRAAIRNLFNEKYSTRAVAAGSAWGAFPPNTVFYSPAPTTTFELAVAWRF